MHAYAVHARAAKGGEERGVDIHHSARIPAHCFPGNQPQPAGEHDQIDAVSGQSIDKQAWILAVPDESWEIGRGSPAECTDHRPTRHHQTNFPRTAGHLIESIKERLQVAPTARGENRYSSCHPLREGASTKVGDQERVAHPLMSHGGFWPVPGEQGRVVRKGEHLGPD